LERIKSDSDKILEEYFLSFDSVVKNKIISESSESRSQIISKIENAFVLGNPIEQLISTIGGTENAEFISTLRNNYYFAIIEPDSDLEGLNNSTIKEEHDKIINSGNELFIRLKKEWSEIRDFENELPGIVQNVERNSLKRELQKVEEFDSFEISDSELEQAVGQLERAALKRKLIDFDEADMADFEYGKTGTYDYASIEYKLPLSSSPKNRNNFRYAVAASFFAIIIIGAYLLIYDMKYNSSSKKLSKLSNQKQIIDSLINIEEKQKSIDLTKSNEQLATASILEVTSIVDKNFGFVQNTPHQKINLTVYPPAESSSTNSRYGLYKLKGDSLFIISNAPQASFKIYYFDINAQTEEIVDSSGQFIELERPALKGFYLYAFKSFFSINEKSKFAPLTQVDVEKKELLKYYTK